MKNTELNKIADAITHDHSNRRINLSTEEKILRIKEFLRMIEKFENLRGAKCTPLSFETILLPQYITLPSKRLGSCFRWLKDNWKQYSKSFPEIPDFEQAKRETSENKMVDTWDKKYVNKKFSKGELSDAFKGVFETLPPKPIQEVKKHSQVALMRRMESQGKVYDVSKSKWVKKEKKSDSGLFVDPENALKKYKDSKMEVK